MLRISIFLIAMVSLLIFSVSNATEVILKDTPNVGDTTTIYKDGTPTTFTAATNNTILDVDKLYGSSTHELTRFVVEESLFHQVLSYAFPPKC